MSDSETFFDTNVLLYLLSADTSRADRVEELLERPGVISVQVLNEFAAVASRKLRLSWAEIREVLAAVRGVCRTEPVTTEDHDRAVDLAARYRFSFYDSVILATALRAGCTTLYSEDMKHRQRIDGRLSIINPFA
ncbi:MAG: PIN domain-containing protein [Gammaproteobacteria bacterium]|nr:MAG: PIN domain-containing protein [Gammaproteobacteria bacterium]